MFWTVSLTFDLIHFVGYCPGSIGVFKHQWIGQMDLDTVQQISMHWITSSKVDNPNGLKCSLVPRPLPPFQ